MLRIGGINAVIGAINFAIGIARNIPGFGGVGDITFIPQMMAQGGLVTKPTNAIIGEAGPEMVIPLDRVGPLISQALKDNAGHGGTGGGGNTYYVTANYPESSRVTPADTLRYLQALGSNT